LNLKFFAAYLTTDGAGAACNDEQTIHQGHLMKHFSRISVIVAASAFALLTGCATGSQQATAGQYIDDTTITARVKTAIYQEPTLKSAEVNVETFKGRVQLSGFVSTRANIERAGAVAKGVNGVTAVSNDLRLK
jgi:osmotically-inducible protein OsmY